LLLFFGLERRERKDRVFISLHPWCICIYKACT
jgi:hypothetical protein